MVNFIQAQNVSIAYLEDRFNLERINDESFFKEWWEDLPEIVDWQKQYLDRIRDHFLRLIKRPPILENAVKMVVVSPLLDLAGFYDDPFLFATEESIELAIEEKGEIIRGRIDALVIQAQFWLLIIESKRASFSLLEAIPQAITYMLASPEQKKPIFGCVTNGEDFQFIKLTHQKTPIYDLSDKLTLSRRDNELYQVLKILKNIGQIIS